MLYLLSAGEDITSSENNGDVVDSQNGEQKRDIIVPDIMSTPKPCATPSVIASREVTVTSSPQRRDTRTVNEMSPGYVMLSLKWQALLSPHLPQNIELLCKI